MDQLLARHWKKTLVLTGCLAVALFVVSWSGADVWQAVRQFWRYVVDERALETLVIELGWLGPLVLIAANILQIVIAPVPGYVVQAASGYLFGPFWGGLWASIGLLCGAMAAMWIARVFGRPLVERLVGKDQLAKWEDVIHSDSSLVWVLLLLGPIGDIPYWIAGLSHVRFSMIFLITLAVRIPSVFVMTAIAGGAVQLSWWSIGAMLAAVAGLLLAAVFYQHRLRGWVGRLTRPLPIKQTDATHE